MARLNPQEKKRLLQKRAKCELEAAGYGLKKLQGGGFLVINGETEEVLAQFDDIERLGQVFGLWGEDVSDALIEHSEAVLERTGKWPKPPDKDPQTGKDTPETAAVREKIKAPQFKLEL